LGIAGQTIILPKRVIIYNHLNMDRGILIQKVIPNNNTDNSSLSTGDVIVSFNRVPVGSVDELYLQLNEEVIGKRIEIDILKKGVKKTIQLLAGEAS